MVILRQFQSNDMERMLDIFTDSTVNKTYMLPDFAARKDAIPLFQRLMALSENESHYVRCIVRSNIPIGFLNDVKIKDGTIELGYVIHPDSQGRGYMTAALKAAIKELFAAGYHAVLCGAFAENTASMRVMEKAGMHRIEFRETIPYRGKDRYCIYYKVSKEA